MRRPAQPDGPPTARFAAPAAASRAFRLLATRFAAPPAASRARRPLASALASVGAWLLEPAEPARPPVVSAPAPARPVIAVFGLARGCGATVVARALAAELATRDALGAAAVHCEARAAGIPLATHAANRLARQLADVPGAEPRAVGRLCLVGGAEPVLLADTARHFAPLVLDSGTTSLGGVSAALADQIIVVAGPSTEPALTSVAAEFLAQVGHEPIIVRNRTREGGPRWPERVTTCSLPDSRMGAQLALGGREPRGELGRAVAALARRCEERLE